MPLHCGKCNIDYYEGRYCRHCGHLLVVAEAQESTFKYLTSVQAAERVILVANLIGLSLIFLVSIFMTIFDAGWTRHTNPALVGIIILELLPIVFSILCIRKFRRLLFYSIILCSLPFYLPIANIFVSPYCEMHHAHVFLTTSSADKASKAYDKLSKLGRRTGKGTVVAELLKGLKNCDDQEKKIEIVTLLGELSSYDTDVQNEFYKIYQESKNDPAKKNLVEATLKAFKKVNRDSLELQKIVAELLNELRNCENQERKIEIVALIGESSSYGQNGQDVQVEFAKIYRESKDDPAKSKLVDAILIALNKVDPFSPELKKIEYERAGPQAERKSIEEILSKLGGTK